MSFGGAPTLPPVSTVAAPTGPTQEELEAQEKAEREEAEMLRLRKGRASTIMTSPWGVTGEPTLGKKTLMGE